MSKTLVRPFMTLPRYKVCFCDSEHGKCESTSDFAVEIGYVHVSGVHCLLTVTNYVFSD